MFDSKKNILVSLLFIVALFFFFGCSSSSEAPPPVPTVAPSLEHLPAPTQAIVSTQPADIPVPTTEPETPAVTAQVKGDSLPSDQNVADTPLIAFVTDRDGEENREIYVMDAHGENLRNLTNHPADDFQPAWSPDGAALVFASKRDGNNEIYTMAADGSNVRRLTDNPETDVLPAWSPDGSTIAFTSERDGNWEIYRMDTEGANLRRLTTEAGDDLAPAWSPDGARLLFYSDRAGNDDIYVMNSDGSQVAQLTDDSADDIHPAWSPDGQQIVFASNRSGHLAIYLMRADGTGVRRLSDNTVSNYRPGWSPDGETIIWHVGSSDDMPGEIFAIKVDGSNLRRLTNHPADDSFARVQPVAADTAITFGGEPVEGDLAAILGIETRPGTSVETTANEPSPEPTPASETPAMEAVGPVKIAFLGALELDWQQEQLNWSRLAVEDFNAKTGWNVELVEVDAGTNPATIMSAIDPVVGDSAIYAAIGPPFSSQIAAASAIFDSAALPHIIFNGAPGLTQPGYQNVFRLVPADDLQGPAAARFMVDTLGAKKVFVIVQQGQGNPGAYGYELYTAFEQTLTAAGGAIIQREPIAPNATDFSSLIASIEASGAEAVFGADIGAEQGALIAQAMREAGLDTPLVGQYGWVYGPFAAAAEGVYVLSPAPAVTDPALAQRYTEQYGPFGAVGPLAYAAIMVELEAVQRATESGQLTTAAVRDEIANTNQTSTILGRPIAFETSGNLQKAQFYILQVENGAFKTVAP